MADIKGLTIEIGADIKDFSAQIRKMQSTANGLSTQLRNVDKALKFDPTNADLLSSKLTISKEKAAALEASLNLMNQKLKLLKSTAGFEEFDKLEGASAKAKQFSAEVGRVDAQLAKVKTSIKSLAEAQGLTSNLSNTNATISALEREGVEVKQLKTQYEQLKAKKQEAEQNRNAASAVAEYRKLQSAIAQTKTQIQELEASEKQVEQVSLAQATNQFQTLGNAAKRVSSNIGTAFATLGSTVSPMIQMAGRYAIESANDTDSAYRNMRKTVQGTEEEFEALRQSAIRVSNTSVVSADTILNIEAMGGQLGIAVDELETFASVVSSLDIATDMDADTIAESLGQMANVLKMSNDDLTRFGDSLVRLGNNMPAQESAIMDISSRISSMGSIVGMSTPDILAWSTAIASTGQNSEAAGTAISNTMGDIESACANGGEQLELFAQIAGMSADEFKTQWDNGGVTTVLKNFITGLNGMEDGGESATAALENLGITGVRQVQSIEGLMNTVDTLDDALQMSNDAWNGVADQWGDAGDAAREAAQKSEGFSGTLGTLKNVASNIGAELANSLTGPMQTFTGILQNVADEISKLPEPAKTAIAAIAGIGAAAGPVTTAVAIVKTAFGDTGSSAKTMASNIESAGGKASTISGKLSGLAGSVKTLGAGLAVAGVAIAGAFVVDQIQQYQARLEKTRKTYDLTKDSMKALTDYTPSFQGAMQTAGSDTEQAGQKAQITADEMNTLRDTMSNVYDTITTGNQNFANTKGTLDECLSVLERADTTYEDAAAAVEIFNAKAGTNLEVVKDGSDGFKILKDGVEQTKDALDQLTSSIELNALKENASANYQSVYDAKKTAIEDQLKAQESLNQAQERMQELDEAGVSGDMWMEQAQVVSAAKANYDECTAAVNNLETQENLLKDQISIANQAMSDPAGTTAWLANSTLMQTALVNSGKDLSDFSDSLANTGVSTSALSNLTQEQLQQMAANYDGTTSSITSQLVAFAGEASEEAKTAAQNLKNGMSSEDANIVNNVSKVTGVSVDKLYEMGAQCGVAGSSDMAKFAAGIASKQDETGRAVDLNADEVNQLKSENFNAWEWGGDLGANFARGISNAIDAVGTACNSLADTVKSILGHSIPKSGPLRNHGKGEIEWGEHLVANFAKGMTNKTNLIRQASAQIAKTVDGELNSKRAAEFSLSTTRAAYQSAMPNVSQSVSIENQLTKADIYDVLQKIMRKQNNEQNTVLGATTSGGVNVNLNYTANDDARTMFTDLVTRLETLDNVRGA